MEESKSIPEFKRKEINPRYLSGVLYEDEEFRFFKFLFIAIQDFGHSLSWSEIIALKDYQTKAEDYLKELISIMSGKDVERWMSQSKILDFKNQYHPKSRADELIFEVYVGLCNEVSWIEAILEIEERNGNLI